MRIDVLDDSGLWKKALGEEIELRADRICSLTFQLAPVLYAIPPKVRNRLGVAVVLADDAQIQELNRAFRQIDKPTNVLSFPHYHSLDELKKLADPPQPGMPDEPPYLGDLIFAYETIAREAQQQGKTLDAHLAHLLVHGCLHLLGYDHQNENDANIMEKLEIRILEELSIANPYTPGI